MEKKNKKLQLNKETIRNLSDENLSQVAGGGKKSDSAILICVTDGNSCALCSAVVSCAKKC